MSDHHNIAKNYIRRTREELQLNKPVVAHTMLAKVEEYVDLIKDERNALEYKYKNLVQQLDRQLGTPCEQIRHKQEMDKLREENEELSKEIREMSWQIDPEGWGGDE